MERLLTIHDASGLLIAVVELDNQLNLRSERAAIEKLIPNDWYVVAKTPVSLTSFAMWAKDGLTHQKA